MRPRNDAPIPPADRLALAVWSRRMIGACVLLGVAVMAVVTLGRDFDRASGAQAGQRSLDPTCARWHETASEALVQLVQSTRDADLRQVGDAVFRMRRARRNCETGWVKLACQDYRSVVKGVPGLAMERPELALECPGTFDSPKTLTRRHTASPN
jgi:hypothetical protein